MQETFSSRKKNVYDVDFTGGENLFKTSSVVAGSLLVQAAALGHSPFSIVMRQYIKTIMIRTRLVL